MLEFINSIFYFDKILNDSLEMDWLTC